MATAVYKGRQRGLQLQPQYAAFCQCRINMPPSSFSNTVRLSRPALITEEMAFAIESRYQETALSTENGLLRVSVDVQAASKAANERRKRNAKAVRRCRQRRKDRDRETKAEPAGPRVRGGESLSWRERSWWADRLWQYALPKSIAAVA